MKAVLSLCLSAALLLPVGCSTEPTADDFEAFATAYAGKATRDWPSTYGADRHVTATLKTHDLRKTDSLTSPFVGSAVYDVEVRNVTVRHPRIEGYETPAVYHCLSVITFEWSKGAFKPISGTVEITRVETPKLSDEQRSALGSTFATGTAFSASERDLENAMIYTVDNWARLTLDDLKKGIGK